MFAHHAKPLVLGALPMVVCYALFYITTVFSLSYGVATLHIPRPQFLGMLCVAVIFMAAATPLCRLGGRPLWPPSGAAGRGQRGIAVRLPDGADAGQRLDGADHRLPVASNCS